jgi:hypothetical protein
LPSIVNNFAQTHVSAFTCAVMRLAGDVILLDTTKELIHSALLSPTAAGALSNGAALDKQADDEFSDEVSAAIVDWIAKRMSDYHKNFHDTQLMQVGRHLQRMCV